MTDAAQHMAKKISYSTDVLSGRLSEFSWVWIGTAILFVVSGLVAPGTVRPMSMIGTLPFAAMLAIVAVGQTLVIQQRGLDMSSAGIMTLGGILVATFGLTWGSLPLAIVGALACSGAAGLLNGLLVARMSITPIVATLATNAIFLGAIQMISSGSPIAAPRALETFSHEQLFGVPYTLILALAFIAIVTWTMAKTVLGRRFIAVGANPRAAAAAGVAVLRYQIGTYVAAALCFSVAGILYAGFIGSASPSAGNDYLLPSIAAVVVGGTPFTGGRGSVIASGVAALFMTQLGQMVLALGATPAQQLLVQAAAIVVATAIRHVPDWLARIRK
jgi:ribose transport system permease protein